MSAVLEGEQIVYAANDWRTDNRTSSHHIASGLSKNNSILYLEAAGQRTPRASGRDIKRIVSRIRKGFSKPKEVQHNIHVLSPLIVPLHGYDWAQRLNERLLRISVRRACRMMGFERPIVWMAVPHYASIMDAVPAKGVVYYCIDDFASFPNTDREAIRSMEDRILSRANVVFAVSERLFESKSRVNPNTVFSPHGVDVTHFRKALATTTPIPQDIEHIPRPIAGFFGLVEEWFDLNLLEHCATLLDDVSFVVIGRTTQHIRRLSALSNVHFLGQKPYEIIPNYLRAFSVGLIPFKINDTIVYSNPLKFKEYLAGGKPVVSVRIGAFEKYEDLAYLADSYQQFAEAIRRAIDEDSPERASARVVAMEKESWDARVESVCEQVRARIPK